MYETKAFAFSYIIIMKKKIKTKEEQPVKGQDFADPKNESDKKPSSHGEVANQKDGDFTDLEESRMDNPPAQRDTNGSENPKNNSSSENLSQENGI